MGLSRTQLVSVSSASEMAVLLNSKAIGTWVNMGTLARAPLAGGAPREVLEQVQWADWAADGTGLAVVRDFGGRNRLEYPIGKPLYETGGWIGHPRVSPKGDQIAFIDHPVQGDDSGSLAVIDLSGHKKTLSGEWFTIQGVAWSPNSKEVWFTASKSGVDRTLYAITLDGKERMVLRLPGAVMILDIFKMAVSFDARELAPGIDRNDGRRQTARSFLARLHLSGGCVGGWQDPACSMRRGRRLFGLFEVGGLVLRRVHSQDRRLARRAARGRWRGCVVARREIGDSADTGTPRLSSEAFDHRRWRSEGLDQRQYQSFAGPTGFPMGSAFCLTGNEPGKGVRL